MAGCGGGSTVNTTNGGGSSNGTFSISPGTGSIDTNCTGCNANASGGTAVEQFSATLTSGGVASVTWSVSGGDANSGAGSISASGQYTPPGYLTADSATVTVTAALTSNASTKASASLTVTPGFLQPLSPENVALGSGGTITVKGYIAEAGGTTGINYAVANSPTGSSGGPGSMSAPNCVRSSKAFTSCSATYTAPASLTATSAAYIVGTVGTSSSKTSTIVLLNMQGVNSDPTTHQAQLNSPIQLGSSGGNNKDYDQNGQGQIVDCCGGTLGALVKNSSGTQYLLSNNHVLARSDQAAAGEMIVQPGLIEDNCVPYGQPGAALTPVATLTGWVPIKSASTNVDAAIAQVNTGAVDLSGAILELGTPQGGKLAAAPPGISSSGGKGQAPAVGMSVAKSGRTTGLTCAGISTVALNVQVSYFTDCAETKPYYTKTYTNQIGISGNQFTDAGDSGSLVVNTANAEPVGLFFAGGQDQSGVGEGVANPVSEVLSELSSQVGSGTSYTFVGATDHPVSCLNYGNATATAAQARALSGAQLDRAGEAMTQARMLVNPSAGILGVATGKSSDRSGEGTVIVYVDPNSNASVPPVINGVRTTVIPASVQAVATGTAPQSLLEAGTLPSLPNAALRQAIATKDQLAQKLMNQNPAFFGVGVGQSFDNPREAALVIYVDRSQVPSYLPPTIGGLRTRYIVMERLHVTRTYLSPTPAHSHCMPHPSASQSSGFDLLNFKRLRGLNLF